jgi:hypothetical protein
LRDEWILQLFNDAFNCIGYLASSVRMTEWWTEMDQGRCSCGSFQGTVFSICLKALRKTMKNLSIDKSLARNLNLGLPKCEASVLTSYMQCSASIVLLSEPYWSTSPQSWPHDPSNYLLCYWWFTNTRILLAKGIFYPSRIFF